ncbi:phosphodiesterase [Anaerosporobacter faecicola]|uniref:phosphodiesterase n=1 Tax=Anaerosporobacter faecicola TaxID=2718714 RepID=UPI0014389EB2|nr:phosphodiesterase [Anaerosporobacter faecicola]
MKLVIASDIHGSAYYCKKLLSRYKEEKADKLILLGDLLYHGPRNDLPKEYAPKEVIQMLNEIKAEILCVRGNCEAEVDQMVLEFPVLSDSMILYLDGRMVFATHGHLFHKEHLPQLKAGDILLHGHTHVQALERVEGYYYMNPGSVSIPKNGNENSYMVYENGIYTIKNLDGKEIDHISVIEE